MFEITRESIPQICTFVNSTLASARLRTDYGENVRGEKLKTGPFAENAKGCRRPKSTRVAATRLNLEKLLLLPVDGVATTH